MAYRFSPDGIEAKAPTSSGQTSWVNVREACETKHNFVIFISHNLMYIIPKRCFEGPEQEAGFRELLREQLMERARVN
jgi:hypothetical protein